MVQIKQQLVPTHLANKVSFGRRSKVTYITIHDTGNASRGANAQVHANLQSRGNPRQASWHYQVDDKEIIQSFPDNQSCWHCSDGRGDGNMNSIGIETCVNSDGDFTKAIANTVALTKYLMKKHNIPVSRVVRHYDWSKKYCPRQLMNGRAGLTWQWFKSQIANGKIPNLVANSSGTSSGFLKYEYGKFTVTVDEGIIIRNEAGLKANKVGTLKKEQSIVYTEVYVADGYTWIRYADSGKERFIPVRKIGESAWGTFAEVPRQSNDAIAKEILAGVWGNGNVRKARLEAAKYNYNDVQKRVQELKAVPKKEVKPVDKPIGKTKDDNEFTINGKTYVVVEK